jgi:hypothetical protein
VVLELLTKAMLVVMGLDRVEPEAVGDQAQLVRQVLEVMVAMAVTVLHHLLQDQASPVLVVAAAVHLTPQVVQEVLAVVVMVVIHTQALLALER